MNAPLLDVVDTEIASLLIPIEQHVLLVPNVSVAEIVPLSLVIPVQNAPSWYFGNCSWREQTVPLLSFEVLNGDMKPSVNSRSRFAVINTTGQHDSLPFIAILTQGLPRLARVTPDDITEQADSAKKTFELMHVKWNDELAVIPDIEAMEHAFLRYLHLE